LTYWHLHSSIPLFREKRNRNKTSDDYCQFSLYDGAKTWVRGENTKLRGRLSAPPPLRIFTDGRME
jgi:hypothetical protein